MRAILFVALFSSSIFAKDIWDEVVVSSSSASVSSSSVIVVPPIGIQTPKTLASSSSENAIPASSSMIEMAPASARSMPRGFVEEQKSSVQISSQVFSSSSQQVQLSSSNIALQLSSSEIPIVSAPLVLLSSSSAASAAELLGLSSSSSVVASSSSARSRRELLGPVKVSRVNAIDEMKGSYKSPRKALFLSLVLPGAGQLYVGGSTANYARGAFYFATELALGGLWYHYSVTRYDQQVSRYEAFARAHYSIGKYEDQIYSLYNQLSDDKHTAFKDQYLSDRQEYCGAIYNDPNTNKCSDIATADAHRGLFPKDSLIKTSGTFYNPSVLYRIVGGDTYVMGWDDVTNVRSSVDISTDLDNSKKDTLGVSSNLVVYKGMRKTANRYAGYQAYFLGGILLNHIISAVDATVAAYSHNQGLYEEKVSWVDHLRFDSSVQWIGDWSTQVQARLEF